MPPDDLFAEGGPALVEPQIAAPQVSTDLLQEQEIVRLLLTYGHELATWEQTDNMYVGSFIIQNLSDVTFDDEVCKRI